MRLSDFYGMLPVFSNCPCIEITAMDGIQFKDVSYGSMNLNTVNFANLLRMCRNYYKKNYY